MGLSINYWLNLEKLKYVIYGLIVVPSTGEIIISHLTLVIFSNVSRYLLFSHKQQKGDAQNVISFIIKAFHDCSIKKTI